MTEKQIKALAAAIARDLFTNGNGDRADRLVLSRYPSLGSNLGGWSQAAVRSRVEDKVRAATKRAKK